MEAFDRRKHWDTIYQTRQLNEVSWYEPVPETSLDLIRQFGEPATTKIIDIGGGDSFLVDHLLENGYQDITVLDISAAAIERAKQRLGKRAETVKWIVADVTRFQPTEAYDVWHDRAAFHFLTSQDEISDYITTAERSITPKGTLIIGTFSKQGPSKCSGIKVKQYSESSMTERLKNTFEKIKCITLNHITPFDTIQNFVFCSFKKLPSI